MDFMIYREAKDEAGKNIIRRCGFTGMPAIGTPVTRPVRSVDNIFDLVNNWNKILTKHTV